jgi:sigma-E factor negative regulatory protein RseA
MNEQMKEKLSAFMDGELDDAQLLRLLESDPDARATWTSYHLIRDALHQDYVSGAQSLADRVARSLENEPTVLAPKRWYAPKQLRKQAVGVAIAATIAAVAILVVRETPTPLDNNPQLAVGPITNKPVRLTADEERKLSGYVVSHTEFSASARMKGMLPYTRIVSFTPAQSVSKRK